MRNIQGESRKGAEAQREIPILFTGEMIRAILARDKWLTSRVIKPQPSEECGEILVGLFNPTKIDKNGEESPGEEIFGAYNHSGDWGIKCPYGKPGDVLWVKEGFQVEGYIELGGVLSVNGIYLANGGRFDVELANREKELFLKRKKRCAKTSGRFMYRSLARLTPPVKKIWVARAMDISEEEVLAEGVWFDGRWWRSVIHPVKGSHKCWPTAQMAWQMLWDSINAKRGLGSDVNPWVWRVQFEKQGSQDVSREGAEAQSKKK